MDLKIYGFILPLIGLIIPCVVILFGSTTFGIKKVRESEDLSRMGALLSPFREAPWWVWVVALVGYTPFVIHSIELWYPTIIHVRELVDIIWMIIILIYSIACCIAAHRQEKKKKKIE